MNPNTGDAAYKISGGSNGAILILIAWMALSIALALIVVSSITSIGILATLSGVLGAFLAADTITGIATDVQDVYNDCGGFILFAYLPIILVSNLLGPRTSHWMQDVLIWLFGDSLPSPHWC